MGKAGPILAGFSGGGGGGVGGSGTAGLIPRWTANTTLGDSTIQDDGATAAIAGVPDAAYPLRIYGRLAIEFLHSEGGGVPGVAVGAGAGTAGAPSASLESGSTDFCGTIVVNVGTAPTSGAPIVVVTFSSALVLAPVSIQLTIKGLAAVVTGIVAPQHTDVTNTGWTWRQNGNLTASTTFRMAYQVVGQAQ